MFSLLRGPFYLLASLNCFNSSRSFLFSLFYRSLYIGAESNLSLCTAMAPRIKDGDAVVTVSHHAMRTSVAS